MPYYNKKYYRKKRYFKKTLKKSNIFSKRSSRSQARQIYALNKKVNYIQKTTKPELQLKNYNIWYKRFLDPGSLPKTYERGKKFFYEDVAMNENTPAPNRIVMTGEMMRVRFIKFFGQFGIYNDTSLSGQWAVANSKTLIENDPCTAYLRIIVARLKKGGGRVPEDIINENPIENALGPSAYDSSYIINGPLQKNTSSQLDILKNKIIKVDISKPFKQFSFKLSAKKLGYIFRKRVSTASELASGENELIVYYYYTCPNLLNYVDPQGVRTAIGPQALFSLNYNIGYVDQN